MLEGGFSHFTCVCSHAPLGGSVLLASSCLPAPSAKRQTMTDTMRFARCMELLRYTNRKKCALYWAALSMWPYSTLFERVCACRSVPFTVLLHPESLGTDLGTEPVSACSESAFPLPNRLLSL